LKRWLRHDFAASFNSKTVEKSDQIHVSRIRDARDRGDASITRLAGDARMKRGNVANTGDQKEIPWDSWTR
jgi:hypothetical protein